MLDQDTRSNETALCRSAGMAAISILQNKISLGRNGRPKGRPAFYLVKTLERNFVVQITRRGRAAGLSTAKTVAAAVIVAHLTATAAAIVSATTTVASV